MKTAEQLLVQLDKLEIKLTHADGKLRCNAPKGAMTPALRDSIKRYKPDLIRILQNPPSPPSQQNKLSRIPDETKRPLSFSQERIWLLSKLEPENHFTGNIHFSFDLNGSLNIPALEQAISALLQRHEVLRTCSETVNHQAVQLLIPATDFHLTVQDLAHLSEQEKTAVINENSHRFAVEPFDLAKAPILRAKLLKTGEAEYIFLLATHLYVFDGWSTALLLRELSVLYTAFHESSEQPQLLPPLNAQYVDFAHWYRHWFSPETNEQQLNWWREKLADTELVTALPQDFQPPTNSPANSASIEFTLPGFLTDAINNLSRKTGTTLFNGLLAAFQTLLYAYTRQQKLATGTIVSNRRLAETEAMIGSFANNILITSDFPPGINFHALLKQVAKTSREVYARQDLPFEQLLGTLNTNLTQHPLFRIMFVLHQHNAQAQHSEGLTLTGLNVKKRPDVRTLSRYDLELVMVERNGGLSGLFIYNANLFQAETIISLKNHFLQVLKKVTDHPEQPLSDLPAFQEDRLIKREAEIVGDVPYTAPRNQLEMTIALIWQDLFGIETIGIHQRFVDLGGHSLLAIRLLRALQDEFHITIPLTEIATLPTIAEFASYLEKSQSDTDE